MYDGGWTNPKLVMMTVSPRRRVRWISCWNVYGSASATVTGQMNRNKCSYTARRAQGESLCLPKSNKVGEGTKTHRTQYSCDEVQIDDRGDDGSTDDCVSNNFLCSFSGSKRKTAFPFPSANHSAFGKREMVAVQWHEWHCNFRFAQPLFTHSIHNDSINAAVGRAPRSMRHLCNRPRPHP